MPAENLREFLAWLKANPDRPTQGIPGIGSAGHVGGILFQNITGTRFQQVPYRENLTFTKADGTADYLQVQDFFDNLYIMRFGSNSMYYVSLKSVFETNASHTFNLVYSTGTDRLYENRDLG